MKLKKLLIFPILIVVFFLFFALGIFLWWKVASKPVTSVASEVRFVIPRGRSVSQVATSLHKEGLIRSPLAFKFYVQLTGKTKNVQAGEFQLSAHFSVPEIVTELSKGPLELWVTIPEGLRREEIVGRFVEKLEMKEPFASQFRQEFLSTTDRKEGFLFPDTYLFPRDASASAVVKVMTQTFDKKVDGDMEKAIAESVYSLEEIVTLASIVKRETKTDGERPIVAGILLNRISIGMGLQADATVQYAVANENCKLDVQNCSSWWPVPTLDDLQIDSPFNTYKYSGLPPAPIANPGESSLKAAVFPEETEYLYYIHDPEGTIHYAKTLSEHNANVSKYL